MPNEEQSDENNIRQQEEIEGDMDNEEYMNEQQNEKYEIKENKLRIKLIFLLFFINLKNKK